MRYLITFACYGGHLHGDERGSVDRHHNLAGSRLLAPDPERVAAECRSMLQKPYVLDQTAREVALYAGRELKRVGSDGPDRKRWARHGSTRWLRKDQDVIRALRYVIDEQGEPMALFVAEEL